jgi:hypothetical protein
VSGGGTGVGGAFAAIAFARMSSISRASSRRSTRLAAFFFSERLHDTGKAWGRSRNQRAVPCAVLRGATFSREMELHVNASLDRPKMDDDVISPC